LSPNNQLVSLWTRKGRAERTPPHLVCWPPLSLILSFSLLLHHSDLLARIHITHSILPNPLSLPLPVPVRPSTHPFLLLIPIHHLSAPQLLYSVNTLPAALLPNSLQQLLTQALLHPLIYFYSSSIVPCSPLHGEQRHEHSSELSDPPPKGRAVCSPCLILPRSYFRPPDLTSPSGERFRSLLTGRRTN